MIDVKTICTIGPSCESFEILEKLALKGMNIARFNFSHASRQQFLTVKKHLERINKKQGTSVKILIDLQGPRIRVGKLPQKGIELKEEELVLFSIDPKKKGAIHIDDPYFHLNVEIHHPMYLSNGDIELVVEDKKNTEIIAKVVRGGILYSRKAVNVPETNLTTSGLTDKDRKDVLFAVENGVEYIGQSFVKNEKEVEHLRQLFPNNSTQIIAKIESKKAVKNLYEIIAASDLVMVARGDLGIELPLEDLPGIQKTILKTAKTLKKPSIVATQMLMSMVSHHRPTRAEVSDVANAVFDGAWGLVLSDETAFGNYPIEALQFLIRIIASAKKYIAN